MIQIKVFPLKHLGEEWIGMMFEKDPFIHQVIRKVGNIRWSRQNHCWYMPIEEKRFRQFQEQLKGRAQFDTKELKDFLRARKQTKSVHVVASAARPISGTSIPPVNAGVLDTVRERLVLRAYSPSTMRTYINELSQFLQTIKSHPAERLTESEIRRYLRYCFEKLQLSENTLHSRINALKFYYEQVLGREKFFVNIPRPKKSFQLPRLLNEKELARLFNALKNKKHKAMLFTAYSAGLRVSEVVALKISDIDSSRMQIRIARAKGKKDRYVNLSPVLLDLLRKYIQEYRPAPKVYLFESEHTGGAYPTRTVQAIFGKAKLLAGIRKDVGIHSLRHSFATHLLDKGTDIKYIKELLGHFNIRTTERYLHVSKKKLVNIMSPFDDLWRDESIEW